MINHEIITDNPIFVRELRRRMRGRGLIVTLCVYVAAMCLWALATIHWKTAEIASQGFGNHPLHSHYGSQSYTTTTSIGQSLSYSLLLIQVILVLIVAPTI